MLGFSASTYNYMHKTTNEHWEKLSEHSSGASGGRGDYSPPPPPPPPRWNVDQNAEWEKHYDFSTFETVLCTDVD